MRAESCLRRRVQAFNLLELVIASGIVSVILLASYFVFDEGLKLYQTNRSAAEGQAAALKVLSHITFEVTSSTTELTELHPPGQPTPSGLVLASPVNDAGNAIFDPVTGELYWQKVVSYYFVPDSTPGGRDGKVFRGAEELNGGAGTTVVSDVATAIGLRPTSHFQHSPGVDRRLITSGISGFEVRVFDGDITGSGGGGGTVTTTYDVIVEAGVPNQRSSTSYYIKVNSKVSPQK